MILALDIGNGSVKYARFVDGCRVDGGRLGHDAARTDFPDAARVAAVSVNPPVLARMRELFPAVEVPAPPLGAPADCGADRVMGVVGALHRCPDAPGVLLFDAGTCLTATVGIRGQGILGGAILPGSGLMARALAEGTQTLPLVEPHVSERAIGASTPEAIRSGIEAAIHGAVRELIRRCREEAGVPLTIVAAGTGGESLAAAIPEIDESIPFATLWGVFVSVA